MSRETLNLAQAAEHVHMTANELKHCAQRGELEAVERGGEWYFEHRALDEWAQRSLLAAGQRTLAERHRVMMDEHRRADISDWGVARLFSAATIDLAVAAKAKDLLPIKEALISSEHMAVPAWLEVDIEKLQGTVLQVPVRDQIDLEIDAQLIVELYSK